MPLTPRWSDGFQERARDRILSLQAAGWRRQEVRSVPVHRSPCFSQAETDA
jgi:hypothetical protein